MTAKYGTPYFSNYINSDMEPSDVRSMCPMTADTNILVKSPQNGIRIMKIGEIYTGVTLKNTKYEVWTPNGWKNGKPVRVPMTKVYKIKLSNGVSVKFGENHLQPVKDFGTLKAKDLKLNMWLPFNKKEVESQNIGNNDLGFVVGAFLGDGSFDDKSINYSLNKTSKKETVKKINQIWNNLGFETEIVEKESSELVSLRVKNNPKAIIEKYVSGTNALDKGLKRMVFNSSIEFKKGLIDGFKQTDDSKDKNRLYTSSNILRNDFEYLFSSLGQKSLINYEDNRSGRLGTNINYRIDYPSTKRYENKFDEDEDFNYFMIVDIEEMSVQGDYLYCFELETEDHLFMLANGLITHNCRLRLDLRELRRKSGGYFGSGESTGCYDEQTEVLTDNKGWILFKDLTIEDVLITRNKNGIIEKHNPIEIYKFEYNDKLYHFKNKVFDMMVTPNHNMVYVDKHTKEQGLVRADQYSKTKHPIPRKAIYNNQNIEYFYLPEIKTEWICCDKNSSHIKECTELKIKINDWLSFLGWFLSEGSTDNETIAKSHGYRVRISQTKKENRKIIEKLLNNLPFEYSKDETGYCIYNKQLWTYCRQFKNCYHVFIPRDILNTCSSYELQFLLKSLMLSDGSINKNQGQKTYYTVSKQLADDFQELCLKCGYSTNIRTIKSRDCNIERRFYNEENNSDIYEMTITENDNFYIDKDDIELVDYKGFVYCCQVENHTLMVRRNGKSTWCGNSVGVVTINMPRIAYLAKDENDFYTRLDKIMDISAKSLKVKRNTISKLLDEGLYPYTKKYLGSFDNHFSTIGLVGMNEAGLNACWLKKDMTNKETQTFSKNVLNHMRERLSDYQELYGDLYNLEATPK